MWDTYSVCTVSFSEYPSFIGVKQRLRVQNMKEPNSKLEGNAPSLPHTLEGNAPSLPRTLEGNAPSLPRVYCYGRQ